MASLTNDIELCAQHLRSGELVSFPTETVYGLGANALNPDAVLKIFQAKGRPLTDPVIVHVTSVDSALALIDESNQDLIATYRFLADTFWPGPLTLVCKASSQISPVLTANTGFVGIRSPRHPLARTLIDSAGVPVAAPSANLFAHVSPTTAGHVLDDFSNSSFDIKVLDGGQCQFGIESTVAKLIYDGGVKVVILRKGGVSQQALAQALPQAEVLTKETWITSEEASEAPGQNIKHYSPCLDTLMVVAGRPGSELHQLKKAVVIDYNGTLKDVPCLARKDLSADGDIEEAVHNLYEFLRWSESVGADCVLLPDIRLVENEHTAALFDRIYRATSGTKACINNEGVYSLDEESR